ncbi:MAG: NUDIX domain-containing protein, partial [Candidatus Eisenbacteria bacterium]
RGMIKLFSDHIETYIFRRRSRRIQILCLHRAPGTPLPGVWQPVTGRRERGERALVAAAREVREETGLEPIRWWGLETISIWFESANERFVALPLFAAEASPDAEVTLSREHDAYRWLAPRAASASFAWQTQRRALEALDREVLRGESAHLLDRTALLAELEQPASTRRRKRPPSGEL